MLETKIFEVRDDGTFIPVVATYMVPDSVRVTNGTTDEPIRWLLRRAGYGYENPIVLLARADGHGEARCDPYEWIRSPRTMPTAHLYIAENWDRLRSGDVIDVEYILGERPEPKRSERLTTSYGL